jgi:hypothetical protein
LHFSYLEDYDDYKNIYFDKNKSMKEIADSYIINAKSVICLNTKKIYGSMKIAKDETGCRIDKISKCCLEKGFYTIDLNKNKLVWMFYDEYLKHDLNYINKYFYDKYNHKANTSRKGVKNGCKRIKDFQ